MNEITEQAKKAVTELIELSGIKAGAIMVIGCSSSEIGGGHIGKNSSVELARAAFEGIYPVLRRSGIYIASQCCEHLNRAVVIEREAARRFGFEEVCVLPQPKAGGSFASVTFENLTDPVVVEEVTADAGMDIGLTLIGMHLKRVAVPVRLSIDRIGEARIVCARTRPKLIGGSRAVYPE